MGTQQPNYYFYYDLNEQGDRGFRNKIRVIAFVLITVFWVLDLFFVAGYVLGNAAQFINIVAIILGFLYTFYGKFKQCKEIKKFQQDEDYDKRGLTAIINACFAKTKEIQGEEGYDTFGFISGLIVSFLQILSLIVITIAVFYLACMCLNNSSKDDRLPDAWENKRIQKQNKKLAKQCFKNIKCVFLICVPILGWIGFVYHIAFAFVMTIVSHKFSDFFVVIAPVLDVLFYILELWLFLCKSRVLNIVRYKRERDFRTHEQNAEYFPKWYDRLQQAQISFRIILIILICAALVIFLIQFPKTAPYILFFVLACIIMNFPLIRMGMLSYFEKELKFNSKSPFIFHSMTGSFFILIVFHFMQFGSGWGLMFWLGFGVLGNYILARAMLIRMHTEGDKKRYYLLGDDLFEIVAFWVFKVLNYASYFFDILLYWHEGSRVGHIILDVVLFYDFADFIVTVIIYAVINRKYFQNLFTKKGESIAPIQGQEEEIESVGKLEEID